MLRPRLILAVLVALTAAGLGIAYASTLGVSSQPLAAAERKVSHGSCTLNPSADSFTDESHDTSNYGSLPALSVSGTKKARHYAFVRFDLAACSFPSGYAVDDAKLTLSVVSAPSSTRTLNLWRAGGSWSESAIRWSNQPSSGASVTSASIGPGDATTSFWVTADVIAYLGGPTDNGWQVTDANSTNSSISANYSSDEGGTRPVLLIDYAY
jgi:hypothetical protein